HAAPGEGLELVRTGRSEPCGTADLTDRHLLAAAYDDIVLGREDDRARRPVKAIKKRPQRPLAVERHPDPPCPAVALGLADLPEPQCGVECRELSSPDRSLGARDPAAVAGDGYIGEARLAPWIEHRSPTELGLVPLVPQLQGEADLNARDHPFMQQEVIG